MGRRQPRGLELAICARRPQQIHGPGLRPGEEPERARAANENGDTPLMWLPDDPDRALEIAALLVEHGADPARRNAQALTAADLAARRGFDDVAARLAR